MSVNIMLGIEGLSTGCAVAMVVAIVLVPLVILVINYLLEYRDWKDDQNTKYIEELKEALATNTEKPAKPVTEFNKVYIYSLVVSVLLASIIGYFLVPQITEFVMRDAVAEPAHYFAVGAVFSGIITLYLDKKVARSIADGTLKQKELEFEEELASTLESKFQSADKNAPAKKMSSYAKAKLQEFLESLDQDN